MSTVDKDVTPEPEATPVTTANDIAEEPTDAELESMDLDDSAEEVDEGDSLLGPIVGTESMAVTALFLAMMTFFGFITQWFRMILADTAASTRDEVAMSGKGYAIGGLLTLVFSILAHLQIRAETQRWARGIAGATTVLGLIFLILGAVIYIRAGAYPASPGGM